MLELPRHALHAARIALAHPVTGRPLAVEAPVPTDMTDFWDSLAGDAEAHAGQPLLTAP